MRNVRRLVVTTVGLCMAGAVACTGNGASGGDAAKTPSKVPASSSRLPLAPPNAVGEQPTQVDPNELLPHSPCDALRESGALNLTSPLKDTSDYRVKFMNGGWCVYGPKNAARNAPTFSLLYEGRKGDHQAMVNYGDAMYTAGDHLGRDYPGKKPKTERVVTLNTDPGASTLISIDGSSKPRRYVGVVVTTRALPQMTMLIYVRDPLNRTEASQLAYHAAASAFRMGLLLQK